MKVYVVVVLFLAVNVMATMVYGSLRQSMRNSNGKSKFGSGLSLRDSGRLLVSSSCVDLDHLFNYMVQCIDDAVEKKSHPTFPTVIHSNNAPDVQQLYKILHTDGKKQVIQNKYLNDLSHQELLDSLNTIYENAWIYYGTKVALTPTKKAMFFPTFRDQIKTLTYDLVNEIEIIYQEENSEKGKAQKDEKVDLYWINFCLLETVHTNPRNDLELTLKAIPCPPDLAHVADILFKNDTFRVRMPEGNNRCSEKKYTKMNAIELTEEVAVIYFHNIHTKSLQTLLGHLEKCSNIERKILGAVCLYNIADKVNQRLKPE